MKSFDFPEGKMWLYALLGKLVAIPKILSADERRELREVREACRLILRIVFHEDTK